MRIDGDCIIVSLDNLGSSTTHIIEVTAPGLYIVIVTDSTNCVDMDSIEVIVYPATPLNPMTAPNPPEVCVGDSVVIEVNQGFVNKVNEVNMVNKVDGRRQSGENPPSPRPRATRIAA